MEKASFSSSTAAAHQDLVASFLCTADVIKKENTNEIQEQTKTSQYF